MEDVWHWVKNGIVLMLVFWPVTFAVYFGLKRVFRPTPRQLEEAESSRRLKASRSDWRRKERYEKALLRDAKWREKEGLRPRPVAEEPQPIPDWDEATDHYGPAHQALRDAWKGIIKEHGAECHETVCVMPDRHIATGTHGLKWHLAHDHETGGRFDYLGPAHAACNEAEALYRGTTWAGAPMLEDLLESVGYVGEYPHGVMAASAPAKLIDPVEPMPTKQPHSPARTSETPVHLPSGSLFAADPLGAHNREPAAPVTRVKPATSLFD